MKDIAAQTCKQADAGSKHWPPAGGFFPLPCTYNNLCHVRLKSTTALATRQRDVIHLPVVTSGTQRTCTRSVYRLRNCHATPPPPSKSSTFGFIRDRSGDLQVPGSGTPSLEIQCYASNEPTSASKSTTLARRQPEIVHFTVVTPGTHRTRTRSVVYRHCSCHIRSRRHCNQLRISGGSAGRAPASSSNRMTSVLPCCAARNSGVKPL